MTKIMLLFLALLFGIFMIIYGGIDDSPGGQLLGLFAFISGTVGVSRRKKK